MSWTAFLLIAASIAMHSLWHFLCKSSGKSSWAFFALFSTSLFLTMLPFALCSGILFKLDHQTLKYVLTSSIFATLGDLGLMLAYKYSDISLAYPMARALPVFMTMAGTMLFGWGKNLGQTAIAGMLIIFAGCMLMALSNNNSGRSLREKFAFIRKGLPGILLAAFATTAYTIMDSFGVKSILESFPESNKILAAGTYSCIRESLVTITMWLGAGALAIAGKDNGNLKSLTKVYHPYAAGIFAALAYVLILISMNYVSNVSYVQSFRQLSLPLSAFLGYFILKEKITKLRWLALLLIMSGLLLSVF